MESKSLIEGEDIDFHVQNTCSNGSSYITGRISKFDEYNFLLAVPSNSCNDAE